MANLFEKTMSLCLEDKAVAPVVAGKKRTLTEKKQLLKEQEENIDDELGIGDPEVDPFEAEMSEFEDESEDMSDIEMSDIEDSIMVVIDPEKSENDDNSELQDMVDDADGNTVSDEYIDEFVYQCPICGNSFFSGVEMQEEDECPVCGEFPSGFILDGKVEAADDISDEEEDKSEDDVEETESIEDVETVEDVETDDDNSEEDEEEEEEVEEKEEEDKKESVQKPVSKFQLDESTFNPYLTKFVRENYKNARSLRIVDAKSNDTTLTLECKLVFKSGKSKMVEFVCENYTKRPNMILKATKSSAFKSESYKGSTPFMFKCSMRGRTLRCEGMKYNFVTKTNENKMAHVYGKYINESRKPINSHRNRIEK